MDLSFSAEEEAFRDEVRAFLDEAMPPEIALKAERGEYFHHDEIMAWHKVLYAKGWVAPHWPKAFGGAELDATRRFILAEEQARRVLRARPAPGRRPSSSTVTSTLQHIAADARAARITPPAVTVIGDVVTSARHCRGSRPSRCSAGGSWCPGPRSRPARCRAPARHGGVPEEVPTISVEPPRNPQQMDKAVRGLVEGRYEWIAFT